ncbi:TPA: hypothetical protein L4653_005224 [Pseudomonas aeruginosa]|nr:hypothetical protein [Pseudomonas aeruginosa]HBO6076323.1 hypothetical protein [Pseudomonas aeruginosa]HEK1891468.1 hypothetical protein [Pseudomonas aeruginosa]HEP9542917.1 hypothetical protein [Pseudomonas aeruginosa]
MARQIFLVLSLPTLFAQPADTLFYVIINDIVGLNAFLHGLTHASISFPFAFVLHL